ncbi:MAG: sensor domain-containing diguanylate cyclase [Acidobacteria bacterium]|nr:sensor domain-containing diguanylate cyclase [Acidobacteriota bacterium]
MSDQLRLLGEAVRSVNSLLEPDAVVAYVMERIKRLVRAEGWSLLLVDEATGELVFKEVLGERSALLKEARIPPGKGIAGAVAQSGEAMIVNDVSACPQFNPEPDHLTKFKTRCVLAAPLKHQQRVLGVVEVVNKKGGENFTREDLDTVQLFLEPAAIALQNAFLFEQTKRLAMIDDLTQLANSRYLFDALARETGMGRRYGFPVAVIFLDLDGFKQVNDRYGHLVGSRTLKVVADILRSVVRNVDIVARYGGDEFTLVLPNTSLEGAKRVAERARIAIEKFDYASKLGVPFALSASFGVAVFPEHGNDPEALIHKADSAMYSVKETTKNAVAVYSEESL